MTAIRKPRLAIVPDAPSLDEIREQSARAGKRVCDAMRAEIVNRNWEAVHIAGDRRPPIDLPDCRRRGWRG